MVVESGARLPLFPVPACRCEKCLQEPGGRPAVVRLSPQRRQQGRRRRPAQWELMELCQDCPPPPDFMLLPPPPPPPPLQELCHYQGDCSHHPVVSNLNTSSSILHAVTLVTITSITIILVLVVSCVILLRYVSFSFIPPLMMESDVDCSIFRNRRKKSEEKQQKADLYRQVNCATLGRDVKIQELNLADYNYYISDRDSVGDHIYEVIDDCYEVIRPPAASANCSCSSEREAGNGNVYIRKPQHFHPTDGPIVTVRFDQVNSVRDWQQRHSQQRHFNSLKTFKTERTFT